MAINTHNPHDKAGEPLFDLAAVLFLQKKVNFLRSYVDDLADQNQVLLQTIEDLQTETDDRFANWGSMLRILDGDLKVRHYIYLAVAGPDVIILYFYILHN